MKDPRKRYAAILALVFLGLVLYLGIRLLQGSCIEWFDSADPRITTQAEAALLLSESRSLYDQQNSGSILKIHVTRPLSAVVSGRVAMLWVSGPIDAGDLRYAQLWQQVYQRYHNGSRCVHLQLRWKNGGILQQFPLDTL